MLCATTTLNPLDLAININDIPTVVYEVCIVDGLDTWLQPVIIIYIQTVYVCHDRYARCGSIVRDKLSHYIRALDKVNAFSNLIRLN